MYKNIGKMKKSKFFSALFVCLFALGFTACDDNDNGEVTNNGNNTNQGDNNGSNSGDESIFELKIENLYGEWECKASNMLYSLPEDTLNSTAGTSIFITKSDEFNYKRYNGTYEINEEAVALNVIEGENTKTYTITKADSVELVLKNEEGVSYTFKRYSDTINNVFPLIVYNAVDLGLSVKWADRNIGAADTTAYGNYFAWGEKNSRKEYTQRESKTTGKTFYTLIGKVGDEIADNDVVTVGENIYKKVYAYTNEPVYTITEKNGVYSVETAQFYDAATEHCGTEWRTPTDAEFAELIEKCTWEWTTIDGVNGYKITGTNENYIFLPAAGFYGNDKNVRHAGEYGYYNTATTGENTEELRNLRFWNYGPDIEWGKRIYGRSVRAVQ